MALSERLYNKLKGMYTAGKEYDKLRALEQRWEFEHREELEAQRKKEEVAKKEDEVHRLLQKNPDDLTGREISRLKELFNDPDIDMDAILTRKELSILSEIIDDTPKATGEKSLFGEPLYFGTETAQKQLNDVLRTDTQKTSNG